MSVWKTLESIRRAGSLRPAYDSRNWSGATGRFARIFARRAICNFHWA